MVIMIQYDPLVLYQVLSTAVFFLSVGGLLGFKYGRKKSSYDYSKDFEWKDNSGNTNSVILYDKRNKVYYPSIKVIKSEKDWKKTKISKNAMLKASYRRGVKETVWKKFLKEIDSHKDVWEFIKKTF